VTTLLDTPQNSSNAGDTTKRLASESSKAEADIKEAVAKNKQQVRPVATSWQGHFSPAAYLVAHVPQAGPSVGNCTGQHRHTLSRRGPDCDLLPGPSGHVISAQVLDTILGYVTEVKFADES